MPTNYTYDNNAKREDLLDVITNLSPTETPLMSGLGTATAENTLHQWLKDTLKSVAVNAAVEGADASYATRNTPSRLTNWTQIIKVDYSVSDTTRAVNHAGFSDTFAYETTKASKEWKNDAEYALVRASLVTGTGSAARQMKGIKNFLANNTSQSGVSLTEAILNDYFQNVWDDGTQVNAVYADMYIKRKISAFTAGTTKNTRSEDKRLVNAVDVYQADAAQMVKLFAHRYVTVSGDTNHDFIGLDEDKFRIAYLRKPKVVPLAKTGDATNAQLIGELTLECLHDDAGFWAQKHL